MQIRPGEKAINYGRNISIADILCSNGYCIHIFRGSLSEADILLKYTGPRNARCRTPKHIHWAVDLLLKKTGDAALTSSILDSSLIFWTQCRDLHNNSYDSLKRVFNSAKRMFSGHNYEPLAQYGEYPADFLFVLLCFIAVQEETNAHAHQTEAVMFPNILMSLRHDELDIFSILSTAGYGGR